MATSYGRGTYGQHGSAVEQILAEMADKARSREEQQRQEDLMRQKMDQESSMAQKEIQSRIYAELIRNSSDPRAWQIAKSQGLALPDYQPLPTEKVRDAYANQSLDYLSKPDQWSPGFGALSAFQVGTGAAMPQVGGTAAINQDIYTRPNMPRQMVDVADISTGRKMSATDAAAAQQNASRTAALNTASYASARAANARAAGTPAAPSATSPVGSAAPVTADPNLPTGAEYLKTLDPLTAGLIKKIADYEIDISKAASMRGGGKGVDSERMRLLKVVSQYDPTFDMSQYGSRSKLRQDFTSGKAATNRKSLNTVVDHLAKLSAAGKALNNVGATPINALTNAVMKRTGDKRITEFNMAAKAVESELAAVFKGTGATDQEIKAWREEINPDMSPQQLDAMIKMAAELMGGRLSALSSQWETGMGKPRDFDILSAKSKKTLKSLGIDPDSLDAGITAGGVAAGQQYGRGQRLSKQQVNKKTGATRTVYSDDGGATWHP